MPWKTKKIGTEDVLETGADGNPVWVDDKGKELAVSGTRIPELNAEAARYRREKEAAEAKLAEVGDLDPVKARDAIAKLALVDQGKLIEAGKLDEAVAAKTTAFQEQLRLKDTELNKLKHDVETEKVANAFAGSEFVKKTIFPADVAQKAFGDRVKVIDGKARVVDVNGNPLVNSLGEHASLDEGLETLISQRPDKDSILRGANNGGTGSDGGGGTQTNKKTMNRAEFSGLRPEAKAAFLTEVKAQKATLVD